MKIKSGLMGTAAVTVLWTVVLAVVLLGHSEKHPAAASTAHTKTAAKPSINLPGEATKSSPGKKHQNRASRPSVAPKQKPQQTTPDPGLEDLTLQARGFLSAYYLIKPEDTEKSRRSRVQPFVGPKSLPLLDLGLSQGTAANTSRVKRHLTLQGKVVYGQLRSETLADNHQQQLVTVPVIISITRPDGKQIVHYTLHTTSKWQQVNGQWLLIDFDKGGGDAG